ncbi:biliverdin-producing heme oxygenase [Amycolatopsis roodepoortensis]|uniref:biliverdin-producing heme oxygenase n=1 Tax=Amycolatopsis roodepoortensis TaxID=700274 RepID=UPI00214AB842|nr:biliverdin-producing heme oxygenase [Amycolatopsis roodepoortensis]UUV28852.1 biliverdin-producing heme oxygenase [Amycolatopsis roodepoortensis]
MPVTTDVESGPFSAALRASTLPAHERANHSEYMNALLGGELTRDGYTRLAIQYYFIYQAIEQAADKLAKDPVAGKFVFEELRRLPSLERDLEHLVGPDWRETIRPLPSTERYARRVAEASDWSGGFVAHHYTRYLGDIAGGQVIRRLLERKYELTEAGSLFYHFDQLGSAPKFRDNYREQLNSAPWTEDERARLIDEAIVAFECNIAVFDELASELDAYRAA